MFVREKKEGRSGRKGGEKPGKVDDGVTVQTPILQDRVLRL